MTNLLVSSGVIALLALGFGIVRLRSLSIGTLILSLAGTIVGLLLGALASVPLGKLPPPFGQVLPILISVALIIALIPIALSQREVVLQYLPFLRKLDLGGSGGGAPSILVDTSVIIDGRIADIAVAGFVPGRLVVPRFVLAELQNIADSEEPMRRGRGRRGLEVLTHLQETLGDRVEVIDHDVPGVKEVDAKLVTLANQLHMDVLTTDYNLNRVAQIQGVRVLNVNELSNAIRPVVIPGEELRVRIVQAGKEKHQGVGYLADGTMIVVENGDKLIGEEVATEVTRVFQTVAGKMIFAAPKRGHLPRKAQPEVEAAAEAVEAAVTAENVSEVTNKPAMPNQGYQNGRARHGQPGKRGSRPRSAEDQLLDTLNSHQ